LSRCFGHFIYHPEWFELHRKNFFRILPVRRGLSFDAPLAPTLYYLALEENVSLSNFFRNILAGILLAILGYPWGHGIRRK
jgi:hypothetical protein